MNAQVGVLAGIARPIPDVATFVTPIFSSENGDYLIQDESNGVVVGFQRVVLGEEFQEVELRAKVQVGDPAMYGFETTGGELLIGTAPRLADAIVRKLVLSEEKIEERPYTKAAIVRFIDSVARRAVEESNPFPYLIEFKKFTFKAEYAFQSILSGHGETEGLEQLDQLLGANKDILQLAHYDALTGLPNRRLLLDRMATVIEKARSDNEKVAILFIDLDGFKKINDDLGHSAGDIILQQVARRLSAVTRAENSASRAGGDEFVVLLQEMREAEDIGDVCKKIVEKFSQPFIIDGHKLHITSSIGIVIYPDNGSDISTLMRNADKAMYRVKLAGGNSYQFFHEESRTLSMDSLAMERGLSRAFENKEFELYYQPLWDMKHNFVSELEALVRWNHPTLGLLEPLSFLPIAEYSGLVEQLDSWVIREACRQIKTWHDGGFTNLSVSVNPSSRLFKQEDLFARVAGVLDDTGLAGQYLTIEVSESMMYQNWETVAATLNQLRSIGIKISIEDFGIGYSSLTYLPQLPVDQIKIAPSFVHDLLAVPTAAIVGSIVDIGHKMGFTVVAEGVETSRQHSLLGSLKCDLAQGVYFGKPLPASAMDDILSDSFATSTFRNGT